MVSVRHSLSSISRRTAKQAHFSIPTTAFDFLMFLLRYRPPQTVLTSPHSFAKSGPKQALFATSALPCLPFLPSTIPSMIELCFTKRILKIWNLSKIHCTGITTLELSVPPDRANYAFDDSPMAAEKLDLLDTRLKAIPSLKEIIVNFEIYSNEDLSDDRMIKVRDRGWTVQVTRLPKRTWISENDQWEFDNEEDCNAYNKEWHLREWQREQEQEAELWTEEYYRRRHDPYWKNDSDYD